MPALQLMGRTYPDLQIPANYRLIYNKLVPRNDEKVNLCRYQPVALPKEVLNREHITVMYRNDGYLYTYNALTQPLSGPLPNEQAAIQTAERIWQQVDPAYREQQLEQIGILGNQTRTYTDENGQTVTIPLLWVKYANTRVPGSYEWIGLGPHQRLIEFERLNFWDYAAGRQKTEMWYGDDWVLARRGLGPQLAAPLPLA